MERELGFQPVVLTNDDGLGIEAWAGRSATLDEVHVRLGTYEWVEEACRILAPESQKLNYLGSPTFVSLPHAQAVPDP
jgi:hypothetical protein